MRTSSLLIIASVMCFFSILNAQNHPFPQHTTYTSGSVQPSNYTQAQMDQHVQDHYDDWKNAYLNSGCGSDKLYVEAWPNNNVSEGTGYGLIVTAYMAGYDSEAQDLFDKIYNFYKAYPSNINSNLMAWNQDNCVSVNGPNSATDGDIDIAYGLLLADAQWGSSGSINYLSEAENIINAIMDDDVNPQTMTTKLGDWANSGNSNYYYATRPSDFITSHFRAFEDATSNPDWTTLIDNCYDLVEDMQTNYSQTANLLPDFIINVNTNPEPAGPYFLEGPHDGDYYYNACRVPWRLGTDYLLYGESRAKTAVDNLTDWLKSSTNNNVQDLVNGYYLSGVKINSYQDPAFLAPMAVAAMSDAAHQTWLDDLYADVVNTSFGSVNYYENSIKMICLLVLSGNYWTPGATPTVNPVPNPTLIGYWHNWNDASAPYIELDEVDSRYNFVNVSFAIPKNGTTYDMEFEPSEVSQATLISQIQTLQSQGRKVIISIGGATALVELNTTAERDIFVSSMNNIINTYGFDGIDIDLEGGSVSITGGTIQNPVDDKIINLIDAVKTIMSDYHNANGHQLILTMAPETAFVQGGMSAYGGIWGAYLPIIHALRDSIETLQVQLYNSGSMYGIDGNIYTQGNADFIVSQTEAVLQGFNTAGGFFDPLSEDQVLVGLPACPNAAGGGYTAPAEVRDALYYLLGTGSQPGSYELVLDYPDLRGMMTWSVNWDAVSSCGSANEYADNYEVIFGGGTPPPPPPTEPTAEFTATPTSGIAPLVVNFDASDSSDPNNLPLTYSWDFGDGGTDTGVNVDYTYQNVGTYTATLTVDNGNGGSDTHTATITVQNVNSVYATFVVTTDWGTGYCAEISIHNNGSSAINGWTLNFDLDAAITSLWNGAWTNNGNNNYTVSDVGWNANIPVGGSVTFGFCANYSGSITPPTNGTLNGLPITFDTNMPIPPVVSITEPNNGDSFVEGTVIALKADASDSDGSVTGVDFDVDGIVYPGTNTGGNIWETDYTANNVGTDVITATATDDEGNTGSHNISITITSSGGGGGGSVSGIFDVTSNWNTGYCANITIENNGSSAINGWELIFDLDATINNLWNGAWTNNGNNNYTVENLSWNANIPAGGSRTFGFCASYSGTITPPDNATLNGDPIPFTMNLRNDPVSIQLNDDNWADLLKISPNPTSESTQLFLNLPTDSKIRIDLFDNSGKLLKTFFDGNKEMGEHSMDLNLSEFSAGSYFVRLMSDEFSKTERLVLLK